MCGGSDGTCEFVSFHLLQNHSGDLKMSKEATTICCNFREDLMNYDEKSVAMLFVFGLEPHL